MTAYDSLWQLMTAYDSFWQLLTTFDNIWQHLTTFDKFWQLLTTYTCMLCKLSSSQDLVVRLVSRSNDLKLLNSSSVSTSLPSTATIKPVECWLIFNLAYPFMLVLVATIEKVMLSFNNINILLNEIFPENSAWRSLPSCAAFKRKDDLQGVMDEDSNERNHEENSTIELLTFLCFLLDNFSFHFREIKRVRISNFVLTLFNCTHIL